MKFIYFIALAGLVFSFKPASKLKLPKAYKFIPSGTIKMDQTEVDVQAFYMFNHEITNFEYKEFLFSIRREGKDSLYNACYPYTAAWNNIGGFLKPMAHHYYTHPAYANYPVVNVSPFAMEKYCLWLTNALREIYGDQVPQARIPNKAEWTFAASGGHNNPVYPWGGTNLRNGKGEFLANFRVVGDQNIRSGENGPEIVNDSTYQHDLFIIDNAFITAPSESYGVNEFGLYNMSGNVAEYTGDGYARGGHWNSYGHDIRITSEIPFEKGNPFVGFRPIIPVLNN